MICNIRESKKWFVIYVVDQVQVGRVVLSRLKHSSLKKANVRWTKVTTRQLPATERINRTDFDVIGTPFENSFVSCSCVAAVAHSFYLKRLNCFNLYTKRRYLNSLLTVACTISGNSAVVATCSSIRFTSRLNFVIKRRWTFIYIYK